MPTSISASTQSSSRVGYSTDRAPSDSKTQALGESRVLSLAVGGRERPGAVNSPPASARGSEASLPTWTTLDRGAASSRRPLPTFAQEEEESSDDELASVAQVPEKRTPGCPRKHPLLKPSTSAALVDTSEGRLATPGPSAKAADTPTVKRRASLPGTLVASSASIMANYASTHGTPLATPVKRGRGRPRKSAPEPSVFGLDTVHYMEPLKDPDGDDEPNPFRRRTRSQSRQGRGSTRGTPAASPAQTPRRRSVLTTRTPRRNNSTSRPAAAASTSAAPQGSGPPSHDLDMKTMQRRSRARSASSSPSKRRARPAAPEREMPKATEFQTRTQLCNALKRTLLEAPMPKLRDIAAENKKQQRRQQKEKERQKRKRDADRLRVAPSGVLSFGGDKSEPEHGHDDDEEEHEDQGEATVVFCGSWSVLAGPAATLDDSLAMKTSRRLTETAFRLDKAAFAKSDDGQTIRVTVPCGCMSVRERDAEGQKASSSSQQPPRDAEQCAGEMAVSVTQAIVPEGFSGVAKAMRMTVMTHQPLLTY
ncbi:hypothetical protein LXA43DRAFT_1092579 [Ganoderma leucocontextum]|nr:hypothetical protein LXA43DRAFT_1092579 [Ganoderma leucocontextum]